MTSKELVKVNNDPKNSEDLEDVEYFYVKVKEIFDKIPVPYGWRKLYSWEDKKGE